MPTIHQSWYTADFLSLHPLERSVSDRTNSCFSVLYQFDFGFYRGRLHRITAHRTLSNCLQLYPDKKRDMYGLKHFHGVKWELNMEIGTIETITGWVGTALYAHIAYQNSML